MLAFGSEKETIATGLNWAALAAAFFKRFCAHVTTQVHPGTAISAPTAAMALALPLGEMLRALARVAGIRRELARLIAYLQAQAPRTQPKREHTTGRDCMGFRAKGTKTRANTRVEPLALSLRSK